MSLTKVTYAMINGGYANVLDFGADPTGVQDSTSAFVNALNGFDDGGTLIVPLGRYLITDTIILKTGVTIQGQGNGDRTFGIPNPDAQSSYIFQTTANKSVFEINGNTRQIRIKNISLGSKLNVNLIPSTTINGISMAGAWPNSSTDIVVQECSFYNFNKAVSVVDTALPTVNPDWQCDGVSFNNCTFYMNTDGVYLYTTNADSWVFTNTYFFTGDNANGIHVNRCGTFTAINCFGADIVTSGTPTAAYGILIDGDGFIDTMKFINSQWEKTTNMLYVATSFYPNQTVGSMKIIMDSCQIESDIVINAAINYISFASRYTNSVFVTGNDAIIESYSDYFFPPFRYIITGASVLNTCVTSSVTSVPNSQNGTVLNGQIIRQDPLIPTTGNYKLGDITFNNNVSAGRPVGWVCTIAGSPGTWQPFGQAGYRSGAFSPIGNAVPFFVGEEWYQTNTNQWFKSIEPGTSNTNWVALN